MLFACSANRRLFIAFLLAVIFHVILLSAIQQFACNPKYFGVRAQSNELTLNIVKLISGNSANNGVLPKPKVISTKAVAKTPVTSTLIQNKFSPITPHASIAAPVELEVSSVTANIQPIDAEVTRAYFYSTPDVTVNATPVGEWIVNPVAWPVGQVNFLKIQLWISADGIVDRWELIAPGIQNEQIAEGLAFLSQTILNAAQINSVRVASTQIIELTIDRR